MLWTYRIRMLMLTIGLWPATAPHVSGQAFEPASDRRQLGMYQDTAIVAQLTKASTRLIRYPDSAIALLEQALEISNRSGYTFGKATALLGIGTHYFNKGELRKSADYFRRAYPYCLGHASADNRLLIYYCNNMASVYLQQGHFDTATRFYLQALAYFNQTETPQRDTGLYTLIISNLAVIWQHRNAFRQAMYYSEKSLQLALLRNDSDRIADARQNIGLIRNSIGDTAGAQTLLTAALEMNLGRGRTVAAQMDYCALARNTSNPDSALNYYKNALELSRQTPMQALHKIYSGMGSCYLRLKRYPEAAHYLHLALERAQAEHFNPDLMDIYYHLADIYVAQGRFEQAHTYRKAYADLRDSLNNQERVTISYALEARYRAAEKDRAIAAGQLQLMSRELELRKKNYQIAGALGLATLMTILLASIYIGVRRHRKLTSERVRSLEQEQEIGNLRSVMAGEEKERARIARELHDGIMIQLAVAKMRLRKLWSRKTADAEQLADVLEQLEHTSTELRRTAHNLMPEMLLDAGLTDALIFYCSKLRKETELDILFQHYGTIPPLQPETELYLYRIVQELIQNIIKHAQAQKVLVQINYNDPMLAISVEDDGNGFDHERTEPGMGLKSIYGRVRVLRGTIDIRSRKGAGTAVFLEINITPFIRDNTSEHVHQGSHSR
jgi:two-component system NarL family sensor kinase